MIRTVTIFIYFALCNINLTAQITNRRRDNFSVVWALDLYARDFKVARTDTT